MKKVIVLICMLVAAPSFADYYAGTANQYNPGVVELTIANSSLNISAYTPGLTAGVYKGIENSFQTFCLDPGEPTARNVDVVVNTTFINETTGAVTGPGSHAIRGGKEFGNNLTAETAYLYTKFAQGTLGGYEYYDADGRKASATSLQDAIWVLEDGGATLDAQAQLWKDEAENAVDTGTWVGIGNVRVLNIYEGWGTNDVQLRQDVLYLVPVPGAFLLGMLGLSAAGIKLRKRV